VNAATVASVAAALAQQEESKGNDSGAIGFWKLVFGKNFP
jgi:hypothetical protein